MARSRARLAAAAAAAVPLALAVGGCGSSPYPAPAVVRRAARAMVDVSSYRLTGSARAGQATITFDLQVLSDGNFQGSVDTRVPGSPSLDSQLISVGSSLYVRSPTELQQLGISSLPGNLNPATTWVLQTPRLARAYRASLKPFVGAGLGLTLDRYIRGRVRVRHVTVSGLKAELVKELGTDHTTLLLYMDPGNHRLLRLVIKGRQPVSLRYSDFNAPDPVSAPPKAQIYAAPSPPPVG